MIRMMRRTVPSPTYMRLPPFGPSLVIRRRAAANPARLWREEGARLERLVRMNTRLLLVASLVVLVAVAIAGAVTQLAGGQRPVLFGGHL
jgi:hypothetical protein